MYYEIKTLDIQTTRNQSEIIQDLTLNSLNVIELSDT